MRYRRLAGSIFEQLVAAAVIALARAAVWAWLDPGMLPPISPVAGLAVGLLLLRGTRLWPALLVGGTLGALPHFGVPVRAVGAGILLTIQSTFVVLLLRLRPWPRFGNSLSSTSDVVALVVTSFVGSIPTAAVGGVMLWEGTRNLNVSAPFAVFYFIMSQVLGVLVITPAMLAFTARQRVPRRWLTPRRIETLALATVVLVGGSLVLLAGGSSGSQMRVFMVVIAPLFMWTALRGSPTVALLLPGAMIVVASYGDAHGMGMFARAHFPSFARGIQAVGGAMSLFTALLVANETSHRRALTEVVEREAKLERVLAGSNDGFWEWDVRSGALDVSERVAAMLGVPLSECPRQLKDFLQFVHPEDAAGAVRAVRLHRLGSAAHQSNEFRARHRAGHWVWVQSRGHVALRDALGNPSRISGTLSDITETKQAELALRASQQLFTSFMRYSPAAAFIRDSDGRLIYVNRAYEEAIWGDEVPDWRGKRLSELFRPDVAAVYLESDQRVLDEQRSIVVEQRIPSRRGSLIWLTVKFPLHDHAGQIHVGAMALDITDRRRAEEQRRVLEARTTEAQKLESLGLLAGGVAHDFNNILTSVLGYADLARGSTESGSPLRENLDQIVIGARNAAELTRQMLAYAGRGSLTRQPLSLADLISEMGQLLQVSIGKRALLTYEFATDVPAIEADEAQARQIVMNLILNASEAIGDSHGVIALSLRARTLEREALSSRWTGDGLTPGDYVELEVRDTGAGMNDETLSRIFDPFFSTKFTGRGLGLAAVLGIVRAHRGTIHVDSVIGKGTTFRVLLPACARAVPAAPPAAAAEPWRASGVALVVDDEGSVRRLATAMLVRLGFDEVIAASGGREGIERFRERADEIRVVLLDVTMPDMDGEAVLAVMREHRPDARIILSSGYSVPTWRSGDEPQADGFVGKPYRLEELASAVRGALERVSA